VEGAGTDGVCSGDATLGAIEVCTTWTLARLDRLLLLEMPPGSGHGGLALVSGRGELVPGSGFGVALPPGSGRGGLALGSFRGELVFGSGCGVVLPPWTYCT